MRITRDGEGFVLQKAFPVLLILVGCSWNHGSQMNSAEKKSVAVDTTALAHIADSCYTRHDYFCALGFYTKLIGFDSTNGKYFYRRAISEHHLNLLDAAATDFGKDITLDYRSDDAYFGLGLISMLEFNDSLAADFFRRALAINPHHKFARPSLDAVTGHKGRKQL